MTPTKEEIEKAATDYCLSSGFFPDKETFTDGAEWALQEVANLEEDAILCDCGRLAEREFYDTYGCCEHCEEVNLAVERRLQQLPQWISVGERLPDESIAKDLPDNIGKIVDVLISDGSYVFTDIFVIGVNRFLDFGSAVKFWMLRPTPPEK